MATKEYSCVKRTKKAFEMSLVELSKELPINKVTVKLLCEKAQLSRNAFYFHYRDINDLIANTIGAVLGYFVFRIISCIIPSITKFASRKNEITIVMLSVFAVMFFLQPYLATLYYTIT